MNGFSSMLFCLLMFSCGSSQEAKIRQDFKKYYDEFEVNGSFALYDLKNSQWLFYNQDQHDQAFIPASTFKICHSLIALETEVVEDENHILPWDSVERDIPQWNRDHDLKSAFKNSTVWYYQRVARKIGEEKMQYWLDTLNYGNADISGGIDQFWLTGDLRISPKSQIDFLRRLYNNQLSISQRSMDLVKEIMVLDKGEGYILRAKTGWSKQQGVDIGWYVGYLEKSDNVYFFVNCIQNEKLENEAFVQARTTIVNEIFKDLKLL